MNQMSKCCCYCAVAAGSNMVVILVNLRNNTINTFGGRDVQRNSRFAIRYHLFGSVIVTSVHVSDIIPKVP